MMYGEAKKCARNVQLYKDNLPMPTIYTTRQNIVSPNLVNAKSSISFVVDILASCKNLDIRFKIISIHVVALQADQNQN